jgi:N-acyl-L-homoserine lactone synthetase
MAERIKVAQSSWELDELFKMRHAVYVEQGHYMVAREDGRIYDRFDCYPTTVNIVAISDEKIIGGVRLSEGSCAGLPSDEFFDFSPFLPRENARVANGSMLCVDQSYRHRKRLTSSLMGMFYYLSHLRGITHIVTPANPEIEDIFAQTGYEKVAASCFHHSSGLEGRPMILDMEKLNDRFVDFISRQNIDHFLKDFQREFYCQGETIIHKDRPGNVAYIVVEGKVAVLLEKPVRKTVELDVGAIFGEMALITDRIRTADVVAKTDVDLMVIEKEPFFEQLKEQPENYLRLLRIVSNRFWEVEQSATADGIEAEKS